MDRMYPRCAEALWAGEIDVPTGPILVALIADSYTFSASHATQEDLSGHIIDDPVEIENRSITDGVFDGDDVEFEAVPTGSTVGGIAIFQGGGAPGDNILMRYTDEVQDSQGQPLFPLPTNGGNIIIRWSTLPGRIMRLVHNP